VHGWQLSLFSARQWGWVNGALRSWYGKCMDEVWVARGARQQVRERQWGWPNELNTAMSRRQADYSVSLQ
jgi:hypothetical protein